MLLRFDAKLIIFLKKEVIMAQVSMTVRMDAALKESFDSLCSDFGMSANTAMNIFAKAVVLHREIPFKIQAPKAKPSDGWEAFDEIRKMAEAGELPDLSMNEINEEIRRYRAGK